MKSVYVMKANDEYKIGVSKDPEKREKSLKSGNPNIKLFYKSDPIKNSYNI